MKLWKRMGLNFVFVIIVCILITGFISNLMVDKKFDAYLYEQNKNTIEKIKELINEVYIDDTSISRSEERMIMEFCTMENLFIEIKNTNGDIIFSSGKEHIIQNKMMPMMGRNMMRKFKSEFLDEFTEEKYEIKNDNILLGEVTLGYYGASNITEKDIEFKETLIKSFAISMSIALIFGLGFSVFLSKQLTIPILEVNTAANEIRKGNFKVRSKSKTNTLELVQLSDSINYLAESLENQDMLRKRMTSDMAHEIRTPLTTLQNHIEAFLDGIWEPSKDKLESCHEEVLRLTKLVENLKNIASLEEASLNLNRIEFDLVEEAGKLVNLYEPQFNKKHIGVSYESNVESLNVFMDKDKIRQIIINLLSNSLRYTEEQGWVKIKIESVKENINIIVEDSGIGIPKEDIPYIFERFYRSDYSRDRATGATGIGLAITKALVIAHGGSIMVESEVNKGSKFIIVFPK